MTSRREPTWQLAEEKNQGTRDETNIMVQTSQTPGGLGAGVVAIVQGTYTSTPLIPTALLIHIQTAKKTSSSVTVNHRRGKVEGEKTKNIPLSSGNPVPLPVVIYLLLTPQSPLLALCPSFAATERPPTPTPYARCPGLRRSVPRPSSRPSPATSTHGHEVCVPFLLRSCGEPDTLTLT